MGPETDSVYPGVASITMMETQKQASGSVDWMWTLLWTEVPNGPRGLFAECEDLA